MRSSLRLIVLLVFAAPGACYAQPQPTGEPVLMLAAASTTEAVEEACQAFRRKHPGIDVRTSFGGSSAIARQIVAGARAGVFLSASEEWADLLAEEDLVERRRDLLGNRLVVIVPADSTLSLDSPNDLLGGDVGRLALADPAGVPAGVYARQALERLGLWSDLEARVAAAADVRQALHFVTTGAAEAGIVYASDAAAEPNVRVAFELAEELSEPIRYPLVLLKGGGPESAKLYAFLSGSEAAAIFARHGFRVLDAAGAEVPRQNSADEPRAPRWWMPSSQEWQALRLSFQVGVCAMLASLPAAVAIGYYLARGTGRGKWLIELAVNLPLVLPPVVTGYLLLVLFAPRGPIGGALEDWFGLRIVFTWLGAAIAAAVVSFPLMVRAIRLAFQSVDTRLEMAARSLGAGRWDAFWTVSLPLARSGVLAGCALAFARSLGEFGATIMVAGNIVGRTQTIPLAIYSSSQRPGGEGEVWRLVAISILLAAGALAVSEWLERRHAARDAA